MNLSFIITCACEKCSHIQIVFDYFDNVENKKPVIIVDGTQVKDMDIRKSPKVNQECSLKNAWKIMNDNSLVTLPIRNEDDSLAGVISMGDIAETYMESVTDPYMLSSANVRFGAIAETIQGIIEIGSPEACFSKGKVLIGAAEPEIMKGRVSEGDLVIMASIANQQPLAAIEKGASCIILSLDTPLTDDVRSAAQAAGCTIITASLDTYSIAKQLTQSLPLRHIMITENLITFSTEDYTDNIRDNMVEHKHRAFPVINKEGKCIGTISRRNFLGMHKKQVILVDHNDLDQAVDGIESADVLEIVDHHRLGDVQTRQPIMFRN